MKETVVVALLLTLAACGGDKPKLAPAADSAVPKAEVAPLAQPVKSDPDQELARRVASAIDGAKLHGVDVAVADGVVTLWGTASTARDKSRAGRLAAKVQGVKAVENKLEIVTGS